MVHKIEGLAGIEGGQMPLGETPLPQSTINAIRQWITNGAPNVSSASTANGVFAVVDTEPADSSATLGPVRRVVVAFTQELDANLVNDTTVMLERMTPGGAQRLAAANAVAEHNPAVLLITPATALEAGVYRVTLRGSGGGALANLRAATLVEDFSFQFIVAGAP
jgi:methionine-rich copper-binding protein CopC